ncbi:ParB/RepB/Spo0J family partition protein [Candidatus Saccharibacteria bacterium]|nr:ParB/RepB/Spo0J family partition protein [Candidatus Saccharibacteria bacterium]
MSLRGLGRGFDSLIPTELVDDEFDPTAPEDAQVSKLVELKLEMVVPDEEQPRRDFKLEQLEALAASIREHGVLQPIVVVKDDGKYKIVAGERRWRASRLAEMKTIPAIVRTLDGQNRLELSLIENVQREDLNAIETATAYAKLKNQFNLTAGEIAARVGKSESAVINTMRLLSLPENAKKVMVDKGLSEGQMRPLIKADPGVIERILPRIVAEEWSARKVEQYMVAVKAGAKKSVPKVDKFEGEARDLSKKLGMNVKIRVSARGTGEAIVKFKSEEELQKLCSILAK